MKTKKIIPLFAVVVFALLLNSCKYNVSFNSEKGNGNIVTQSREIAGDFTKIDVANGIEVEFEQNPSKEISVTADENLQNLIAVDLVGNELRIYAKESYRSSKTPVVKIKNADLTGVTTGSGAEFKTTNLVITTTAFFESSSGSSQDIHLEAEEVHIQTSSGSEIEIEGKALKSEYTSSSGSKIEAEDLLVNEASAQVSSGASISVNPIVKLNANASSGGSIRYKSTPDKLTIKTGSGGSVKKD